MTTGKPGSTKKLTQEDAIARIHEKFPQLDLSEFVYVNGLTPSFVTCPEYGRYEIRFKDLMRLDKPRNQLTTGMLLSKFKHIYGEEVFNRYDFSKVEYVHMKHPITIICPTHGEFQSDPFGMLFRKSRTPCKQCNIENRVAEQWDTKESFVQKVMLKCNNDCPDIFDEDFVYLGNKVKTWFKCKNPEHPPYSTRPNDYLNGKRCTRCSLWGTSKPELQMLEFCEGIPGVGQVQSHVRFNTDKSYYNVDIYLPDSELIVEHHGIYHHSELAGKDKNHMKDRALFFHNKGVKYLQVFEDEWLFKRHLVERSIIIKAGLCEESVNARNCSIMKLASHPTNSFLMDTHIQGPVIGQTCAYGLIYDGALVAVLSIGTPRNSHDRDIGAYEILRYSTSISVVGGFSKLLSAFVKEYHPKYVMSYSDLRWGYGSTYGSAGFELLGYTEPGYFWCKGQTRHRREKFQKKKLAISPEFADIYSDDKTEYELCREKGYYRIFDAGNTKWMLTT